MRPPYTGHPRNTELRETLRSGELTLDKFHTQLLRIVYRLIFLFFAEDRTFAGQPLLHPVNDSTSARLGRRCYLKTVRGVPGDVVGVDAGRGVWIGGEYLGRAEAVSLAGRTLEVIAPGVVPKGRYFLHADHVDSHDSRYAVVGLVPRNRIQGRALALPDIAWLGLEGPPLARSNPPACGNPLPRVSPLAWDSSPADTGLAIREAAGPPLARSHRFHLLPLGTRPVGYARGVAPAFLEDLPTGWSGGIGTVPQSAPARFASHICR